MEPKVIWANSLKILKKLKHLRQKKTWRQVLFSLSPYFLSFIIFLYPILFLRFVSSFLSLPTYYTDFILLFTPLPSFLSPSFHVFFSVLNPSIFFTILSLYLFLPLSFYTSFSSYTSLFLSLFYSLLFITSSLYSPICPSRPFIYHSFLSFPFFSSMSVFFYFLSFTLSIFYLLLSHSLFLSMFHTLPSSFLHSVFFFPHFHFVLVVDSLL